MPRIPSLGSKQDSSSSQPARNNCFSPSSLLGTDTTKHEYTIRPVQGKGQGLFATSKIHKGTRILSEAPIFKVPRDEPDIEVVDHAIIRALKILDRDYQRALVSITPMESLIVRSLELLGPMLYPSAQKPVRLASSLTHLVVTTRANLIPNIPGMQALDASLSTHSVI